jgi:hypothetical protein
MKRHLFTASLCFLALTSVYSQKTAAAKQKAANALAKPAAGNSNVVYGKYGCSASKYNGSYYEFLPKGSFVINKNGTYAYNGFAKPSSGTFIVNAATGVISFRGGYFNGGEATPMKDRPNRYYVVFPANPDNRWTCSLMDDKK